MTGNISNKRKAYIFVMKALMVASVGMTCALVLFLIGYVLVKGIPNISWELVSTKPSYLSGKIGILPDILNTLYGNCWDQVEKDVIPCLQIGIDAIWLNRKDKANKENVKEIKSLKGIFEFLK